MKRMLTFLIVACSALPAMAAFKDAGWGARPLGMGGAYTAVAGDANAPLFNPAGIAQAPQKEATFMSAKLFTGLEGVDIGQNYFGYVHPLQGQRGSLAIAWSSLYSPNFYREDTGNVSYARFLDNGSEDLRIALGASARYLRHEYSLDERTVNDPVFASGYSAAALTADIGALVLLPRTGLSFGFASKCVTSPDVGLKTQDVVPMENVIGVAYYTEQLPYLKLPYFTVAADAVSRDRTTDIRIGAESWVFNGKCAVRAGARPQELAMGLGYEIAFKRSETKVVVDYAFAWPLEMEQTSGSHRMAISVRFP